jgi:hypothetical protein
MAGAAITYVFNEAVNLPIWRKYYGALFGDENLYVVDRMSTDGSTDNLGAVNVIKVPRRKFDEVEKTNFMSCFHASLTSFYDGVVVTDCDEIIVPDPEKYTDLNDYILRMPFDYANAIGIDVTHILNEELPLDLAYPILKQRSYGLFASPECKHLLSKTPIKWLPGLHASDKSPIFDPDLFIFHLKLMDYGFAVQRQKTNLDTKWTEASLERNYGAHHRWDLKQFVTQNFFVPIDMMNRKLISAFNFENEIEMMVQETVLDQAGFYRPPMNIPKKLIKIPDRFSVII